jgi:hypothetical protein
MLRIIGVVGALQLMIWTPAWACTGQVGASVFQDNFADDSGGWDEDPPLNVIQPPAYVFTLGSQYAGQDSMNLTFNAVDGDYCMDVTLPPPIAANNQLYAGVEFWGTTDYQNFTEVDVSTKGGVSINKKLAGTWSTISTIPTVPSFNSAANAVNSLRVTALSGVITVYLNGTLVKTVRAQEPTSPALNFGIYVGDDTAVANAPAVKITGYSVTAGK